METSAHDRLARIVAGWSRRSALRTALGGAALATAGALSTAGHGAATNRCKKKRRKLKKKLRKERQGNDEGEACTPKAIGEPCSTAQECCGSTTGLSCAQPSENIAFPVCCGTAGVACSGDSDCCAGFFCPDVACVAVTL